LNQQQLVIFLCNVHFSWLNRDTAWSWTVTPLAYTMTRTWPSILVPFYSNKTPLSSPSPPSFPLFLSFFFCDAITSTTPINHSPHYPLSWSQCGFFNKAWSIGEDDDSASSWPSRWRNNQGFGGCNFLFKSKKLCMHGKLLGVDFGTSHFVNFVAALGVTSSATTTLVASLSPRFYPRGSLFLSLFTFHSTQHGCPYIMMF